MWEFLLSELSGYVPFSQSKIDLFDETNHELSKQELQEAVKLSGYTKKEKSIVNKEIENKPLTNTGRMWACALMGIWKTMIDIDGLKLPATFDSYNICGKLGFKSCSVDGIGKGFFYHCGRIGCEVCAKRAGARIAKKIERRVTLYSLRIQKLSKGRRTPLASHVVEAVNPNSEFWTYTKEKQNRLLKRMRRIAGISGGCVISHPWRFDKSDLTPVYSPHKHLIAFGWVKEDATELIKEKLGIDVIYFKVRNGTLRHRVDVFAVAYYQLSHCAVSHRKHSLQWFGNLANNKISNKTLAQYKDEEYILQDEEIEKSKCCPVCCERLTPARINTEFAHWREKLNLIDNKEDFFEFDIGLLLSVDFMAGEKIPYYSIEKTALGDSWQVHYKQTLKERKEIRELARPDLYAKKSNDEMLNQSLTSFC
ncbi:MAG: hypothetical protein CXT78_07705 [Thaumarchaeota archaeon]|nr:MAG: hypothetical protein CXT78_07705 [Nitrososphaerota archaeon]